MVYEIDLPRKELAKQFMTPEKQRDFAYRFYQEIKPTIDKQRIARLRSIEEAMNHWVD